MKKIVVVDDSLLQSYALKQILEKEYEIVICNDALNVISVVDCIRPSLILLDVVMPQKDGFEILSEIKDIPELCNIPVIMITSLSEVHHEEKGLLLGAVDYIAKPFHDRIVQARVKTHTELYTYRIRMEHLARIDGVTGISNRRYFDKVCQMAWKDALEQQMELTIAMLDIDFFKQYNDTYGHVEGDDALRIVGETITNALSGDEEFVARYGGEEFGIILTHKSAQKSEEIAEEIRGAVMNRRIAHTTSKVSEVLTVSIGGVTRVPKHGQALEDYIREADEMLYRAKRSGRNKVTWVSENKTKNNNDN